MKIGDRVPFRKDICNRFKNIKSNKEECLFGDVVSYDEEAVCISYMQRLFFVKRLEIEKMIREVENK